VNPGHCRDIPGTIETPCKELIFRRAFLCAILENVRTGQTTFSDFKKGSHTMATTATEDIRNRHDRRHPEQALHELMTKKQVAEFLQCSQRQVELLTNKGRLPKPVYLGDRSPRWRRAELLASLSTAPAGGAQ
jgi:predicted DNA-binding transcriptional regulator AlpA